MLTQEQIQEWVDSPVTETLKKEVASYIEELNVGKGPNCYVPYEPQKTQDNLSTLIGQIGAWEIVVAVLDGDWSIFEEEEDEYIGNISEGE